MRSFFGKFIKMLGYYALIPFLASLPAGILNLLGVHPYADVVIVPVLTAVIYVLFRHKMDNAAAAKVVFTGKSVHPGTAKNVMVNAALLAMEKS